MERKNTKEVMKDSITKRQEKISKIQLFSSIAALIGFIFLALTWATLFLILIGQF